MIHLPVLAVLLAIVLLLVVTMRVGRARIKYGVKAPATSGHPLFERAYRVQMNTLEQTVLMLPTLWLAARYGNPTWAGILGLIWVAARIGYAIAYEHNPRTREIPFGIAMLAFLLLLLLAIYGVGRLFFFAP